MNDREMFEGAMGLVALAVCGMLILLPSALISLDYSAFVLTGTWAYVAFLVFAIFFTTGERRVSGSFPYNPSGDIGVIFAFMVAAIGLLVYAYAPVAVFYIPGSSFRVVSDYVYFPTIAGSFLMAIGGFFQGIMMMSMGGFFISYRIHTKPSWLWLVTGIVFFGAGLLSFTMIVMSFAFTATTIAAVLGAVSFLIGKPKRTGVWSPT